MSETASKPHPKQPQTLLLEVQAIAVPRDRGYLQNKNGNNKI
ncbi:hypothetical protein GA0070607_5062 [Micromonospora coriariae]|uniref:Uncharacterized protein n=1 Tax=Micromonospora coriariae TaxID=285665 RepID=A0A1C4XD40_9ACTN|nr:hypothetical protein [Micromonospora coriariae]SCF06234.1 hypothetical protein GA0070607_5062 [Micromonospora coriariae]